MAQEDDIWKRRRQREEEREREAEEERLAKLKKEEQTGRVIDSQIVEKFDELIRRAPIMIDQLEHLYHQYAVGLLSRPPVEERARLDMVMVTLYNLPKPTPSDRFRFSSINSSYGSHKSRWEKLLADIESGKIKRVTGPKRQAQ